MKVYALQDNDILLHGWIKTVNKFNVIHRYAALGKQFSLLDELFPTYGRSASKVWRVAGEKMDLELVEYCVKIEIPQI